MVVVVFFTAPILAQEGNSSPYSFFGIGSLNFRGSVESQAMGGISIQGDSTHINFQNPAGYGALKLTNFTIAGSHTEVSLENEEGTGSNNSTTIDYLALAFPISKKVGAGFGLIPYTSVDYATVDEQPSSYNVYTGRGGLNRAFVTFGAELFPGFRIGVNGSYNFGNIRNVAIQDNDNQQYAIRETNRSDLSGVSFDLGVQYEQPFKNGNRLYTSAIYVPEASINSDNERVIESVVFSRLQNAATGVVDEMPVTVADTEILLPSALTLGLGYGKRNKWFAGGEYSDVKTSSLSNRSFNLQNVTYQDASRYRAGGYFIPDYNSITSYWDRVTYRAGFRFEETGLVIENQGIDEFGISFGLGLPLGRRGFSNANLTFEYGQRGTTEAGLVKEDFFKVGISLSLNPLRPWFVPNKYN